MRENIDALFFGANLRKESVKLLSVAHLAAFLTALLALHSLPVLADSDARTAQLIARLQRDREAVNHRMSESCENVSFCLSHLAEGVNQLGSDLSDVLPIALRDLKASAALDAHRITQIIDTEKDPEKLEAFAKAVEKALADYRQLFAACGNYSVNNPGSQSAAQTQSLIRGTLQQANQIQSQVAKDSSAGIYRQWAVDEHSLFLKPATAVILDQLGVSYNPPVSLVAMPAFQSAGDAIRLAQAVHGRFPSVPPPNIAAATQALAASSNSSNSDIEAAAIAWAKNLHRQNFAAQAAELAKPSPDITPALAAYDRCIQTYKTQGSTALVDTLDRCAYLAKVSVLLAANDALTQKDIEQTARFKKKEFDEFSRAAFSNARAQLSCGLKDNLYLLTNPDVNRFSGLAVPSDADLTAQSAACQKDLETKTFAKLVDSIVATASDHYFKQMTGNPKLKASIDRNPEEFASFSANLNDGQLEPCLRKEIETKRTTWLAETCTQPLNRNLMAWALNSDVRYNVNHDTELKKHIEDIKKSLQGKMDGSRVEAVFESHKAKALEAYNQCVSGLSDAALASLDASACVPKLQAALAQMKSADFNPLDPVFMLAKDFSDWSTETERDVYVYNYRQREFLVKHGFPASGPAPLKVQAAVDYAKEWAAAYWSYRGSGSQDDGGMVGWGLYAAEDPHVSQGYGDVLLKIRVPKGSRYLDLRDGRSGSNIEISQETYNSLQGPCGWGPSPQSQRYGSTNYVAVAKQSFTTTAGCHATLTAATRLAGISLLAYTWQASSSSYCPGSSQSAAFVLLDTPLDLNNVDVFVPDYSPGDAAKDKAYHLVNTFYQSAGGSNKWGNIGGAPTEEEKNWIRQTTMECGAYPKDRPLTPR